MKKQSKEGISLQNIEKELADIVSVFGKGVEDACSFKLKWHRLNLRDVQSKYEQIRLIEEWGRVGVRYSY